MQTDPIGYGDGMNMYAYVGGDPVNGVDPSGMLECRLVTATDTNWGFGGATSGMICNGGEYRGGNIGNEPLPGQSGRGTDPGPPPVAPVTPPQQKDSVLDSVVKCGADQLGVSNLIEADLVRRGLPEAGSKPFVNDGASPGTSRLSQTLSSRFPQKIPGGRIWTPDPSFLYTLEPSDIRRFGRMSATVGRAAGRLIPVVSAALLIYDVAATGICVYQEQNGD